MATPLLGKGRKRSPDNTGTTTSSFRELTARIGWKFPFFNSLSSSRTVILTYHGVPRFNNPYGVAQKDFESHILFLKNNFNLIHLSGLRDKDSTTNNIRVLITFDDGLRNNAEVVAPILREHRVPAAFFICSRHSSRGSYLWYSYLRALETFFRGNSFSFEGRVMDMSLPARRSTIKRLQKHLLELKPHPAKMYQVIEEELPRLEDFVPERDLIDQYWGMTSEQIEELSNDPLFSIGVHTVDHPFLTKCERAEMRRQIGDNKRWLEELGKRECEAIAYPGGDYNAEVLEECRDLGLVDGFAMHRRHNYAPRLEIPRVGIYYPSLNELGTRVRWGKYIVGALNSSFARRINSALGRNT